MGLIILGDLQRLWEWDVYVNVRVRQRCCVHTNRTRDLLGATSKPCQCCYMHNDVRDKVQGVHKMGFEVKYFNSITIFDNCIKDMSLSLLLSRFLQCSRFQCEARLWNVTHPTPWPASPGHDYHTSNYPLHEMVDSLNVQPSEEKV